MTLMCLMQLAHAEGQVDVNDLNTLFGGNIQPVEQQDERGNNQANDVVYERDNNQDTENNTSFGTNELNTLFGSDTQVVEHSDEENESNNAWSEEENIELITGMVGEDAETGEMIEFDDDSNDLPEALFSEAGISNDILHTLGYNPDIDKSWGESEVFDPEQPPVSKARIGAENRTKVNVKKYPYKAIGKINFKKDSTSKDTFSCSGVLVGRRIVLTNGHCIYDNKKKKFYTGFKFSPGFQDNKATYGTYYAKSKIVSKGYQKGKRGYDWGFLVLSKKAGTKVGWLGARQFKKSWLNKSAFKLSGYPSNFTGNAFSTSLQVAHINCSVKSVGLATNPCPRGPRYTTGPWHNRIEHRCLRTKIPLMIHHICDTGQGASGSPIFGKWKSGYDVVAVNYAGAGPRDAQRMNSCTKPKVGKCMNYAASYSWIPELKRLLKKYP